ncbi:hypothetical protein [Nesterenkonia sp. Act20]|uniref:hypothetical protein n=1 Tax=Nesterenkonia sp. Act20 TaxID=1483432 RepID=UPI001C48B80A|nr:hypothetical protein [Nesterenkonia sp. Act20]
MFAASPAVAAASSASPSGEVTSTSSAGTPSGESTQDTDEDSAGSDGSASSAPEPTPSQSPAPSETPAPDPGETTSPDPGETPPEPTPTPDQPATPTPDPSTPAIPEPSTPGTPIPSEDPTQFPDGPTPSEPAPSDPTATPAPGSGAPAGEHYLRCGSAFAGPGETEALRLDMSRGITDLSAGSSLTGAAILIEDGVVYYQAPSPLPRGSSQDDFAVRGQAPDGTRVQARCYVGLQESADGDTDPNAPSPSSLSPTRAAQTQETPEVTPSSPESSISGPATSRATLGGPPIPGMPGYPLPELDSPQTDAATEAAEGQALAQTGLDTLRVSTAVTLALLAIIAGVAALLLASRRVRSAQ